MRRSYEILRLGRSDSGGGGGGGGTTIVQGAYIVDSHVNSAWADVLTGSGTFATTLTWSGKPIAVKDVFRIKLSGDFKVGTDGGGYPVGSGYPSDFSIGTNLGGGARFFIDKGWLANYRDTSLLYGFCGYWSIEIDLHVTGATGLNEVIVSAEGHASNFILVDQDDGTIVRGYVQKIDFAGSYTTGAPFAMIPLISGGTGAATGCPQLTAGGSLTISVADGLSPSLIICLNRVSMEHIPYVP